MHLKIATPKSVIASLSKYGFRNFQRDYETLDVAIDPNISWNMSELIKTHIAIDVRNM